MYCGTLSPSTPEPLPVPMNSPCNAATEGQVCRLAGEKCSRCGPGMLREMRGIWSQDSLLALRHPQLLQALYFQGETEVREERWLTQSQPRSVVGQCGPRPQHSKS